MNKIFVLIGKSGAGKDTLASDLCKNNSDLNMCISTTSRPIRENEIQGIHYNFVSKDEFIQKIENNEILEYRTYETKFQGNDDTWYYGTEFSAVKNNSVLVLDLEGLISLKSELKDTNIIGIYLDCSDDERKRRAQDRGSFCQEEWDRRLIDDSEKFNISKIRQEVQYIVDANSTHDVVYRNVCKLLNLSSE